jgi:hypothetical protein
MLRSIAVLTAAVAATASFGQNTDIIRTDRIQNTMQLNIRNRGFVRAHPSLAWFVFPFEATPDYNFGYAQTSPCMGRRTPVVGNAIYNRIFFRNANVPMGFVGRAGSHAFQKAPPGVFALAGPVEFLAAYNSRGITQREIVFASPPTARMSGPTADLSATLTSNRLSPFSPARYRVTGFFVDQNGINNVNLVTPIGGIVFDTFLQVSPETFTMPQARLDVPTARLTQQPKVITSAFFKAYYELRLQ